MCYLGSEWIIVVFVAFIIYCMGHMAVISAREWKSRRYEAEMDELEKEMEMWQDTEVWDD